MFVSQFLKHKRVDICDIHTQTMGVCEADHRSQMHFIWPDIKNKNKNKNPYPYRYQIACPGYGLTGTVMETMTTDWSFNKNVYNFHNLEGS